jgi:cytochrome c oxidase subunit 2
MIRETKMIVYCILAVIVTLLLSTCSVFPQSVGSSGTAWGTGAFRSNGERIYFTSTTKRGKEITYSSGPALSGWMMMGGRMACASCHGPYGRGGKHSMGMGGMSMGMTQVMDAKDIRWSVLKDEFNTEKFRLAVVKGLDPDGTQLKSDMPRWNISNDDLSDLIAFLKTLP